MATTNTLDVDVALVGGGLQNGLIALALAARQPAVSVALIERDPVLGGNHTWCFHAGDVPESIRDIVDSITLYRWSGYDVRFPNLTRTLDESYAGTTSQALADGVVGAFSNHSNAHLLIGRQAQVVAADHVILADGLRVNATLVIDARGPEAYADPSGCGYQKFVGLKLRLATPHQLERPLLMDATVAQVGGFRFFYILPLASDYVLVEDTTFARDPSLDVDQLKAGCLTYADNAGLDVAEVIGSEQGALPMPWAGQHEVPTAPLRAGYQGGWFHPATGYSFPVAARLAGFIANHRPELVMGSDLGVLWTEQMRQVRFCHRLNKMLFAWFYEGDEWNVFERFYRLPIGLIRRFYALETTVFDRTRLVVGRPPKGFSIRARLSSRSRS